MEYWTDDMLVHMAMSTTICMVIGNCPMYNTSLRHMKLCPNMEKVL
jgi:hypothetical protein